MGRRWSATILGGLGALLLALGVAMFSVVGTVSSASATRNTVESLMRNQLFRQAIADEVVTAIEDSGDTPQEKVVFSLARPLIENAVSRAIDSSRLQDFVGDVSFTAYEVFVEEKPPAEVDVSPVIDVAVDAIKQIDPRIAKNFSPKVKPLTLERNIDSPDLRTIRDDVQTGMWVLIVVGLLLQIAAWFLSVEHNSKKLLQLGRRIAAAGSAMAIAAVVARQVVPGYASENKDLAKAITSFATSPLYVRGIVIAVIGVALAVGGYLGERRTRHGEPAPTDIVSSR